MKVSETLQTLLEAYEAELHDLRYDSEGRDILQTRLDEKRRALDSLLPMIEICPELVAPAFHGAFDFSGPGNIRIERLVAEDPSQTHWDELAKLAALAAWAKPLVAKILHAQGGTEFLVRTLFLEYLHERMTHVQVCAADESEHAEDLEHSGSEEEIGELDEAQVDDYLEQQGFDRLSGQ
jgi:hypothetical protein